MYWKQSAALPPPAAGAAATPGSSSAAASHAGTGTGLAGRARHPEELKEATHLAVDTEYYLANQV